MKTELKTLKDLEIDQGYYETGGHFGVYSEDLKAEAVKWIKLMEGQKEQRYYEYRNNTINWIKHFFNLTDEDLK